MEGFHADVRPSIAGLRPLWRHDSLCLRQSPALWRITCLQVQPGTYFFKHLLCQTQTFKKKLCS